MRPIQLDAFSSNEGFFTLEFPVLSSARGWLVLGIWHSQVMTATIFSVRSFSIALHIAG